MFTFDRLLDNNLRLYGKIPEYLESRAILWPGFPKTLGELETVMERRKELLTISDRTPEQSAELTQVESLLRFPKKRRFVKLMIRGWVIVFLITRHRIIPIAVSAALVIVIIILPVLAYFQARQVHVGRAFTGSSTGIFDYSADRVDVYPAAHDSPSEVQSLGKKKLFLLGQNAQYAVLYSPKDHATIRVPVAAVIITDVPS